MFVLVGSIFWWSNWHYKMAADYWFFESVSNFQLEFSLLRFSYEIRSKISLGMNSLCLMVRSYRWFCSFSQVEVNCASQLKSCALFKVWNYRCLTFILHILIRFADRSIQRWWKRKVNSAILPCSFQVHSLVLFLSIFLCLV